MTIFATLFDLVTDPETLLALFAGLAVVTTVLTLAMPLLSRDRLAIRMKTVAIEREKIRVRERARLAYEASRPTLRTEAKPFMRSIVDRFNLRNALADGGTITFLRLAGYRGQAPLVFYLFMRVTLPLGFFAVAAAYLFIFAAFEQPALVKWGIALLFAYAGFYAPALFLRNRIQKRQTSIRRAWPDALDLMLICVESGMAAESAFRKVSEEVGSQSAELAEELALTTAELSYLQERRQAYENLALRTGIDGVKAVTTALIQSERYGTPLATTLRVMAQENRDARMNEAERKAAALPPKLTVPMILFFLPVLFAVILGPAGIQYLNR